MTELQRPPAKPTLWQRIKNGVSHAIGYIPRGIVLTGLLFAGSAELSGVGMDFVGVVGTSTPDILTKFATHLAIGSAISGVLGATMAPCPPCVQQDGSVTPSANPFVLSETEKGLGQQIAQGAGDKIATLTQHAVADSVLPGSGTAVQAALPWLQKTFGQTPVR